jgi:hypothetical protein
MRRLVLTTVTCGLVLALAPAVALAGHHHKRHHARHHARVHHRRHVRRFGDLETNPSITGANPGVNGTGAAGTVDSFSGGVLTIKLTGGSTVSGVVTSETELECEAAEPMDNSAIHEDGDGGDHGGSGDDGRSGADDHGDRGDDEAENNQECATANLTPGASVRGAELEISSAGAVWEKVELIP